MLAKINSLNSSGIDEKRCILQQKIAAMEAKLMTLSSSNTKQCETAKIGSNGPEGGTARGFGGGRGRSTGGRMALRGGRIAGRHTFVRGGGRGGHLSHSLDLRGV